MGTPETTTTESTTLDLTATGLSNEEIQKALLKAKKQKENAENRVKLTPEERAAKKAEDEKAKADRKAERAKKAEERKNAEATAPAAHMSKVLKARANLPSLSDDAKDLFAEITANLSVLDVSALGAHLAQHVREQQTTAALDVKLEKGQPVRILRGSKNIGKLAVVTKPARVRTYVRVIGASKDEYLFTSDVEPVQTESLTTEESELVSQIAVAEASNDQTNDETVAA